MLKKHNIAKKLIFTLCYLALLWVFSCLDLRCIFITFLHIPCPGCGMSRALISALRLDFISAFDHHLMFWSVPLLYLYFLFDGRLFKSKKIDYGILIFILTGFIINWILTIAEHLSAV